MAFHLETDERAIIKLQAEQGELSEARLKRLGAVNLNPQWIKDMSRADARAPWGERKIPKVAEDAEKRELPLRRERRFGLVEQIQSVFEAMLEQREEGLVIKDELLVARNVDADCACEPTDETKEGRTRRLGAFEEFERRHGDVLDSVDLGGGGDFVGLGQDDGELIAPIIREGRTGMPKFDLTDNQIAGIAAFIDWHGAANSRASCSRFHWMCVHSSPNPSE